MTLYRTMLHRLNGFPGPFLAKVTKLWHAAHLFDSKNHLLLGRLHQQYGNFVRTGPSEVTVFEPEVLGAVDGPGSHCTKAVWYDALQPESLVNTTRDNGIHTQRRRMWNNAFTPQALSGYEDQIVFYARRFEKEVARSVGNPVDASSLIYKFTFDLMGEVAFSRNAGQDRLRDQQWHAAMTALQKGMALLGPLSPVPWLLHIGLSLPFIPIVRDWNSMVAFCKSCIDDRIKLEETDHDISSWLIDSSQAKALSEEERMKWLYGDAITMVIAGSDTVAPSLVFLFYHMALHPGPTEAIRKDLQTLDSLHDVNALLSLPSMTGFIHETLRLYPTTPTGGYRVTPPEGLHVAGRYIPGGTTVVAPAYNIGRLASCFQRPDEFIPERWSSRPDLVLNKRAFAPFKQGRYSCIGKKLALAELSIVVALIVSKYHIRFPPGEDGSWVVRDMRDCFTAKPGQLNLVFDAVDDRC
ncbi:hypothetical protein HO173_000576 [Letharia columbiana]|uniref:Cytochrome P450 n=1 Tax=Letharia columbiana TaxID=112416 RepID=A0A8H6G7M2_9LECA|nr:uncharacterized protein HO173_000576 [Letharia columbiana]KAF6241864.1 hypothetical protein HO173_000576 [Letharia columbiana]